MQRIKIKLEDDQADKLYKIAKDKKENVSSIIRKAIDDYFKKLS
jgi:predicted transcriptional regulator